MERLQECKTDLHSDLTCTGDDVRDDPERKGQRLKIIRHLSIDLYTGTRYAMRMHKRRRSERTSFSSRSIHSRVTVCSGVGVEVGIRVRTPKAR